MKRNLQLARSMAFFVFAALFLAFFFAFTSVLISRDALAQTARGEPVVPSSRKSVRLARNTAGKEKRPNVVFIMADNLGYGDLGCYGGGETRGMPTKNIDKLASESLRFTQFLVEPQCTPTRAAVMTGRYPVRMGLSLVLIEGVPGASGLTSYEFTTAEMFKEIGYDTAIFGKWHLGAKGESQPQRQGFDIWYGIPYSTDVTLDVEQQLKAGIIKKVSQAPYIPYIMEARRGEDAKNVKPYNLKTRRTIDLELTDKSIEYIKSHAKSGKPFFLYLPFTRPHYPNLTSKEFERASRIGIYGDSVMELDHNTGRVLKAIREAGIEDNTIVIWISDNGPMNTTTWPDSGFAGPYRGELGDPHEGSIRTAGMIKWPGKIKPGVSNEMFAAIDFLPTLAAMTGGRTPTDRPIDGVDQSPFLLGKQVKSNREHLLTFIAAQLVTIRWRQYRIYYRFFEPTGEWIKQMGLGAKNVSSGGYPHLYNIEKDPTEKDNILATNGWITPYIMPYIQDYIESVKKYPNPQVKNYLSD